MLDSEVAGLHYSTMRIQTDELEQVESSGMPGCGTARTLRYA